MIHKLKYLLLLLIAISVSCGNSRKKEIFKVDIETIKSQMTKSLNGIEGFDFEIDIDEKLECNKCININLTLYKPKISHDGHLNLLIYFLIANSSIEYYDNISFKYLLIVGNKGFDSVKEFNKSEIESIKSNFSKSEKLLKMVNYSLGFLEEVDLFSLETVLKVVSTKNPNDTFKSTEIDYLELINQFEKENSTGDVGKATFTLMQIYAASYQSSSKYQRMATLIKELWRIKFNKDIEKVLKKNKIID